MLYVSTSVGKTASEMNTTSKTYQTSADFISNETYEPTTDAFSTISEAVTDIFHSTVTFVSNTTEPKVEQNLGLIIGLSVGIPCGVILIIALTVIIFYFYKKQKPEIKQRATSNPGSLYETSIDISRAPSNYYDDVAIPSRNEPVYETVLKTFSPVYETTLPSR